MTISFARLSRCATTLLVTLLGVCCAQAREGALLPSSAAALEVFNRNATSSAGGVIHLDAAQNDGIAWIPGATFSSGRLSFEVKGLDVQGKSFVGVAFHGMDNGSYDCVYLRPFNFNSPETLRRGHSVQYISIPGYDWDVLREQFPGRYEASLNPAPAAESWVHVALVVEGRQLRVFVNHAKAPALTVDLLNARLDGRVGLWVGNNSEGWFRKLEMSAK
jgi:hypothetical protein